MGETSGPVNNPMTRLILEDLDNSVDTSRLTLTTRVKDFLFNVFIQCIYVV